MAFKGEIKIIVKVTSAKFLLPARLTRAHRPIETTFSKTCRSDVIGAGVERLRQEAIEGKIRPCKRSRNIRVLPKRVGSHKRDPRKIWLQRHRGELSNEKLQPESTTAQSLFSVPQLPDCPAVSCPSPTSPAPSLSPVSPNPRGGRPVNPLPRHKRSSHINAEHRRRNKIQTGFETLKELVPALAEEKNISTKESKSAKLHKAAEHVRGLKFDLKSQQDELQALRQEVADLNAQIMTFHQQLPATGIAVVEKPACHLETMYRDYLKSRTQENWKFWIFSVILRPLFESYSRVVTSVTTTSFLQTVRDWAHEHLTLVNLRPCVLSALRHISLNSSILTEPEKLPEEAPRRVIEMLCDKSVK
ncbi:carbohydrate-responsive element-binding protein-like [Haliotis cracherodii]|uniref:carbohydrate-responsive element-binding protein-like n=1 Tax=Haliotis cracherodii TaxID=6455 RepID=UPI0039EC7652